MHLKFFTLLLLVLSSFLSACSFTPKYERDIGPVVDFQLSSKKVGNIKTETFTIASNKPKQCLLSASDSIKSFKSNTELAQILNSVENNNFDVRSSIAYAKISKAQRDAQHALRYPTLTAGTQLSKSSTLLNSTGLNSNKPFVFNSYGSQLGISGFEFDIWGRLRSLDDAALARTFSAQKLIDFALVEAYSDALLNYYELIYAYQILHVLEKKSLLFQKMSVHFNELNSQGYFSELERKQWLLSVGQLQKDVNLLTQNIHEINGRLFKVSGIKDFLHHRQAPIPSSNILFDVLALNVSTESLLSRPDVAFAESNILQANGNIGAARAAFLPNISLNVLFGRTSEFFSSQLDNLGQNWQVSLPIVSNIFDFGKNKSRLNEAYATKEHLVIEYQKSLAAAYQQLQDAIDKISVSADALTWVENQDDNFSSLSSLAESNYKAGIFSELDLLELKFEYLSLDSERFYAQHSFNIANILLYRALGGRRIINCDS